MKKLNELEGWASDDDDGDTIRKLSKTIRAQHEALKQSQNGQWSEFKTHVDDAINQTESDWGTSEAEGGSGGEE